MKSCIHGIVFCIPKYARKAATYRNCQWQFLTDGLASGRFSVLLSVRKYFFPLSGTKRFVKYNVSDGNTF